MNQFGRQFLGQIPLVLGPSSWGAGMVGGFVPTGPCPPGTFMDEDGRCRPRVTMGQSALEYFDVPLGAFPVPWGMGCGPGEVQDSAGRCVPDTYYMGQQMVREGGALEHYDVPLGAFPVPWGAMCPDGQVRNAAGECVPDTYRMGQAAPSPQSGCERTAEGGYRCPDGTYLPPSKCSVPIQAVPPSGGFPWLPVAAGAAAVGAGALLLAGARRRLGATAFEASYPEVAAKLGDYAARINSERAADAFNFQQLTIAGKRRLDLVEASKALASNLVEQNRKWEATHSNPDQLAAAQAAVDQNGVDTAAAAQEIQTYRDAINQNQANIQAWLSHATAAIASLPAEYQPEAKAIIEECFKGPSAPPSMQGRIPTVKLGLARF